MSVPGMRVAEVLKSHVELEVESIDRMYLNVFVPRLQVVGEHDIPVVRFEKDHLDFGFCIGSRESGNSIQNPKSKIAA